MWNYRIVQELDHGVDVVFEIREVYYDVEGLPCAHGRAAITSSEEGLQGLHDTLDRMRLAFTKPVLRFPEDFVGDMHKELDE